jgi:hypothetical protein
MAPYLAYLRAKYGELNRLPAALLPQDASSLPLLNERPAALAHRAATEFSAIF